MKFFRIAKLRQAARTAQGRLDEVWLSVTWQRLGGKELKKGSMVRVGMGAKLTFKVSLTEMQINLAVIRSCEDIFFL